MSFSSLTNIWPPFYVSEILWTWVLVWSWVPLLLYHKNKKTQFVALWGGYFSSDRMFTLSQSNVPDLDLESGASDIKKQTRELFLLQKQQQQHPVSKGRIRSIAMATASAQCQQQCGCKLQHSCLVASLLVFLLDCFSQLVFFFASGYTVIFYTSIFFLVPCSCQSSSSNPICVQYIIFQCNSAKVSFSWW